MSALHWLVLALQGPQLDPAATQARPLSGTAQRVDAARLVAMQSNAQASDAGTANSPLSSSSPSQAVPSSGAQASPSRSSAPQSNAMPPNAMPADASGASSANNEPLAPALPPYEGRASDALAQARATSDAGEHDAALAILDRVIASGVELDWRTQFGLNVPPPIDRFRAELHFAKGVIEERAQRRDLARESFSRTVALAGPGSLRLDAAFNEGTSHVLEGEEWRAKIPEVAQAKGLAAPPPQPPAAAPIPGAPAEEDPLAKARASYLAARTRLVERLRLDGGDDDARANVELVQRRLRELDEIEKKREEEKKKDEQQKQDEKDQKDSKDKQDSKDEPKDQKDDPAKPDEKKPEDEKPKDEPKPEEKKPEEPPKDDQQKPEEAKDQKPKPPEPAEMSREQKMQLLDKLQELEEQNKKLQEQLRQTRRTKVKKDW